MKKIFLFILTLLFATLSCSVVAPMLGLTVGGYSINYTDLNEAYLPYQAERDNQLALKYSICPQAFDQEWVIGRINYWIGYYNFGKTNFHDLPQMYQNIVFDKVYLDIDDAKDEAESRFPTEDYFTTKSNMSLYKIIKKGDIILTRNVYYMNILLNSRYSLHHAMMVTQDPTSDDSDCIITSFPKGFSPDLGNVCLLSPNDLNTEEFIVTLRFYNLEDASIDKAVDYATSKLGMPYNSDYINKGKDDEFYCSQLVYKAYLSIGLDVDETNNNWDDHGIVLPNDIFKSPYLKVVKFGN